MNRHLKVSGEVRPDARLRNLLRFAPDLDGVAHCNGFVSVWWNPIFEA